MALRRGLLGDFQFSGWRPLVGKRGCCSLRTLLRANAGVSGLLSSVSPMGADVLYGGEEGQSPGRAPPLGSLMKGNHVESPACSIPRPSLG